MTARSQFGELAIRESRNRSTAALALLTSVWDASVVPVPRFPVSPGLRLRRNFNFNYSKRVGRPSGSRKLLSPTPTRRNRCLGFVVTRSRSDRAILVNSSQEEGGEPGVWLRVRILNSLA